MLFVAIGGWIVTGPTLAKAPQTSLSYETPGSTVEAVLRALSEKSGTTLVAAPQTKDDIIVVRLKGAKLGEAMERIAWAIDGSWQQEGETYHLRRTTIDQRTEADRVRKAEIEGLQRALDTRLKELANQKPFDEAAANKMAQQAARAVRQFNPNYDGNSPYWQFSQRLGKESPSGRAMSRIMALLDPAELVDHPSEIKVVYSDRPTALQRPFSSRLAGVIKELQREQQLWVDAITRHGVSSPQIGNSTYFLDGITDVKDFERMGKVLVKIIRRPGITPSLGFELNVLDDRGKSVSRASSYLSSSPEPAKKVEPPKNEPTIAWTEDQLAFGKALLSGQNPKAANPVPAALRERLLNPEANDPYALAVGPTLVRFAAAKEANLVAVANDADIYVPTMGRGEAKVKLSQVEQRFGYSNEIVSSTGWITVRPRNSIVQRQRRSDRRVLGDYLRRMASGAPLTIDEQAHFALYLPSANESNMPMVLAGLVQKERENAYYDPTQLRIYGSLDRTQRARALADGLPLSQLNANQIGLVQRLIFGDYVQFQLDYEKAMAAKMDVNSFYSGMASEPTEWMGANWLRQARLKLSEERSEVAFTSETFNGQYTIGSQGFTPEELGWQVFYNTNPQIFGDEDSEYRPNLERLRLGTRRRVEIRVDITPLIYLENSLEERHYKTSQPVTLKELPEDFRKRVQASIEQHKSQYSNVRSQSADGGVPPVNSPPPPPFALLSRLVSGR